MLSALLLAASAALLSGPPLEVVARKRGAGFDSPPLDLAFLGEDRLLALSADALALYALDASGATRLLARASLAGPFFAVRAPAGLLRVSNADGACWAMTNGTRQAFLFAVEGDKLVLRDRASALPWPGVPAGLRYLSGTNVLERGDERLARVAEGGWTVMEDGGLAPGEATGGLRVGGAVAPLWERFAIASSPLPPGRVDALLLLERGEDATRIVETLALDGLVRAIAARTLGSRARVVVALDSQEPELLMLELRARDP